MNTFEKITEARKLLGLPEEASMKEIKANYRKLIRKYHPDRSAETTTGCAETSAKIIAAYQIILAYCSQYRFSFAREEVKKYLPQDEWWFERFGNDPLWGKGDSRQ